MTETISHKDTVMIVDDDRLNRICMKAMLEGKGYNVVQATNGYQCIKLCKANPPSIILLDVIMPGIDGLDVCKELRKQYTPEELPIVIVSTKGSGPELANGLKAGANDYITKPVDRYALLARLEVQLRSSRLFMANRENQRKLDQTLKLMYAMGTVLPEAVAIAGEGGEILYYNKLIFKLCGAQMPAKIEDIHRKIFEGSMDGIHAQMRDVILDNQFLVIDQEYEAMAKRKLRIQVVSEPLLIDSNNNCRLWLWRDFTDMRELEGALLEKSKLETMGVFASGVAHNFNNVLGGISGATGALSKLTKDNERAQKLIVMIEKGVDRASKLTNKILGFGDTATEDANKAYGDLIHVIKDVLRIQDELHEHRILASANYSTESLLVRVPAIQLYDLINNVVSNAFEAIKERGEVSISTAIKPGDTHVEVHIVDNGIGMDQDTLKRLREPFFSTKAMDVENGISIEGHGLGLWWVHNVLRICGGEIEFNSELEEGTEVTITLPLLKEC